MPLNQCSESYANKRFFIKFADLLDKHIYVGYTGIRKSNYHFGVFVMLSISVVILIVISIIDVVIGNAVWRDEQRAV
jgi:hypothetical protein